MSIAVMKSTEIPGDFRSQFSELSFSRGVDRELVHRRALSEVLLTDCVPCGDGRAVGAAQWPAGHRVYRTHHGLPDSILLAETVRQTGILVGHTIMDVPSDYRFIMDGLSFEADPVATVGTSCPAEIVLQIDVSLLGRRTPSSTGIVVVVEFFCHDRFLGRGVGKARCLAPRLYARLRGDVPLSRQPDDVEPADAGAVGVCVAEDVAVGLPAGPGRYPLRVQPNHPIMFDHPLDHVPGMLVMEGMRQAARLISGWPRGWVDTADVEFRRFLELAAPSDVQVTAWRPAGSVGEVDIDVVQDGRIAVQGMLQLCNVDDPVVASALAGAG